MHTRFLHSLTFFLPIIAGVFGALCLLPSSLVSQNCHFLNSQAEVDALECTELNGALHIIPMWGHEETDITDLSPLSSLTSVSGELIIRQNPHLKSLKGLENLTSIGKWLIIENNDSLEHLDALSGVKEVGGGLFLEGNSRIQQIEGLANVVSKRGGPCSLRIIGNDKLETLDGLEWIEFVVGDLVIKKNRTLRHINGLSGVKSVENSVLIEQNVSLKQVNGMLSLLEVGESVTLKGLSALEHVDGFRHLQHIPWNLEISGAASLTDVDGFMGLNSVGGNIYMQKCHSLLHLDGFSNLYRLAIGLVIYDLPLVEHLDAFKHLQPTLRDIHIFQNEHLKDITGLCHAADPNWPFFVFVKENPALSACQPLKIWEQAETSRFDIADNGPDCSFAWEVKNQPDCSAKEPHPEFEKEGSDNFSNELGLIFPNPMHSKAWIPFTLAKSGRIYIRVFDEVGRDIGVLLDTHYRAGKHRTQVDVSWLDAGLYYVQMETESFRQAKMILVQ
ncbi:MAG: T9SS type A sorting domain-containing protein [Bacteroidota bacterium]